MDQNRGASANREKEWSGPWWKHPYIAYLIGVLTLFAFLGFMAYLAIENEWIPKR
ncbi:MAG: hypothetical protein JST04_17875 [Bdellovibrionales bacterium]|nr:hypothetical protein [Bdellovibrionales bacterium]